METLKVDPKKMSYLYLCSNETIRGIEYKEFPKTDSVPLIADMSSDIFSRPFDVNQFGDDFQRSSRTRSAGAAYSIRKNSWAIPIFVYLDYALHGKNKGLANGLRRYSPSGW